LIVPTLSLRDKGGVPSENDGPRAIEAKMEIKDLQKSMAAMAEFPGIYVPKIPEFRMPEIPPNPLIVAVEANYASEFYKRLMKWITDFDASLDQAHEVGVRLVSFGQSVVFTLQSMGYWNPSLLTFSGFMEDGSPVELIQHVTQISVLLMKLPRTDPSIPKRPIGFVCVENEMSSE
jgi:hypothetical protein